MKTRRPNTSFAKKSLGQNFLSDTKYIHKIIAAAAPQQSDLIVEIGPGRGAITELLVQSGAEVLAIELDRDLIDPLRYRFAQYTNFSIVEADVLDIEFSPLIKAIIESKPHLRQTKIVANLPYYISTAILQKLSLNRHLFERLVLMFQREVVDRISAQPGTSDRGYLTVLVEASFSVEKLFDVPPTAFRPAPKVWSSVAKLTPKDEETLDLGLLKNLISVGFAQKRKTLVNNLKGIVPDPQKLLADANIDVKARAEALTLEQWLKISELASRNDG